MKWTTTNSLIVFFCVLFVLFLVNRYLFSWVGLLFNKIYLFGSPVCEFKSISVPVANSRPKRLSFIVDLLQIASTMKANPNYDLTQDDNYKVVVLRKYGQVRYSISFCNLTLDYEYFSEMKLSTQDFLWQHGDPVVHGEHYTTPNSLVRRRIYRMINDLPLTRSQKAEIKRNVRVGCHSNAKSFIF